MNYKLVRPIAYVRLCDAWSVPRQTYGYLPNRRASLPIHLYPLYCHALRYQATPTLTLTLQYFICTSMRRLQPKIHSVN